MRKSLMIIAALLVVACERDGPVADEVKSDSSYKTQIGTATASEREAYSHDLYDKPEGLTSEQDSRYESLSPEGQEYVDEKMRQYDEMCARSSEC